MEQNSRPHSHGRGTPLAGALLITLCFAFVELGGGLWSGSLALISDAGHMFSDSLALVLAAVAGWIAQRPPSKRHTYGLVRAEVVAALGNGVVMLTVIIVIVVEAIERLRRPVPVAGGSVMVIAFIGLMVNALVAYVLSRGERTLNARAALIHVMGDLLGSIAALIAGAAIYFSGWLPIDPILSLAIAGLILFSTLNLLREALHVLMEGVPDSIQLDVLGTHMIGIAGVRGVHDLHVWNIGSGQTALSAHVELDDLGDWPKILESTRIMLRDEFAIQHVTLQPEIPGGLKQPYQTQVRILPKR